MHQVVIFLVCLLVAQQIDAQSWADEPCESIFIVRASKTSALFGGSTLWSPQWRNLTSWRATSALTAYWETPKRVESTGWGWVENPTTRMPIECKDCSPSGCEPCRLASSDDVYLVICDSAGGFTPVPKAPGSTYLDFASAPPVPGLFFPKHGIRYDVGAQGFILNQEIPDQSSEECDLMYGSYPSRVTLSSYPNWKSWVGSELPSPIWLKSPRPSCVQRADSLPTPQAYAIENPPWGWNFNIVPYCGVTFGVITSATPETANTPPYGIPAQCVNLYGEITDVSTTGQTWTVSPGYHATAFGPGSYLFVYKGLLPLYMPDLYNYAAITGPQPWHLAPGGWARWPVDSLAEGLMTVDLRNGAQLNVWNLSPEAPNMSSSSAPHPTDAPSAVPQVNTVILYAQSNETHVVLDRGLIAFPSGTEVCPSNQTHPAVVATMDAGLITWSHCNQNGQYFTMPLLVVNESGGEYFTFLLQANPAESSPLAEDCYLNNSWWDYCGQFGWTTWCVEPISLSDTIAVHGFRPWLHMRVSDRLGAPSSSDMIYALFCKAV